MKHLAVVACILSLFCVLPAQASAPLNRGIPPMAENETYYVRLERWGQEEISS